MNKKILNEHDRTKKMLDTIRYGLKEGQNQNIGSDSQEGGDVITPPPNDPTYIEEYKKISDSVDPRIQITKFKIYPKDRNVEYEGRIDSGINFYMSIKAMKLGISITDDKGRPVKIPVDDDLVTTLQKLNGYYENWTREWSQKLVTDFKH